MKKRVIGVYATNYEAVKAIENLQKDGVAPEHISAVCRQDYNPAPLVEKTGVTVESEAGNHQNRNFWDELKNFFSAQPDTDVTYHEHLSALGLSDQDAIRYGREIDEGRIVILVDKDAGPHDYQNLSNEDMLANAGRISREEESAKREIDKLDSEDRSLNTMKEDVYQRTGVTVMGRTEDPGPGRRSNGI